jgi:alpha-tubulin suppressor-like RCC1 family protein
MTLSLPSLPKSFRLTVLAATTLLLSLAFAADSRAALVGAGAFQSCGISPSGALACWGTDSGGALGTGEDQSEASYDPLAVKGLGSGVTDISLAGTNTTACAIASGGARCWGYNGEGKFGNGTTGGESNTPVQVPGLESGVTKISAAGGHVCAVQNGGAKCWGSGDAGRLGYGAADDSSSPVVPAGFDSGVTDIAAGWRHTCGIKDGAIMCWGDNTNYQLGYGDTFSYSNPYRYTPKPLTSPPPGTAVAIAAGVDLSCALMDSGAVYCWGSNGGGKLGAGSALAKSANPLPVTGLGSGVSAISANAQHACAIKSGTAFCWGDGQYGKLGNGATDAQGNDSNVPVQVSNIGGVTSIAVGANHTCAVASGKYYCWGNNKQRQLGSNRVESFSGVPVEVTGTRPAPPPPAPPVATITTPDGPSKLSRSGVARLATVSCPAGATCAVAAPGRVPVTIRNRTFRVSVLGAGPIASGGRVKLRVSFGKKARKRLGSRTTTVKVKLTTTVNGVKRAKTIRVKVKGRG